MNICLACRDVGIVAAATLLFAAGWPGLAVAAAPVPPMPPLHVTHPSGERAQIVDSYGRTWILRGTNGVGVEDDYYRTPSGTEPGPAPMWPIDPAAYIGKCPQMSHFAGEAPVCEVQSGLPEYAQSSAS